ncbi:MAG: WecB/TagA/CpsF family glycosyltransferase [Porticoccus sp.]|nr:WecB/TagA/CpsF family glycosyltransferase [Porticoccus sp.]
MERVEDKLHVLCIPVSPTGIGDVSRLFAAKLLEESLLITFVNPYACALAKKHADYIQVLESFDIVACDGIGMVKAARASGLKTIQRESFDYTSMADPVFKWAAQNGQRLGLVGGKPGVADQAALLLRRKFPDLQIVACYSGFGEGPDDARRFFSKNHTELVVCGMGAPLQERYLIRLAAEGWHGIGFTCGGFLDQLTTGDSYYPKWVDKFNIRFLYRLAKEPGRLWRRYLIDYQVFLKGYSRLQWEIIKSKLGVGQSPDKVE